MVVRYKGPEVILGSDNHLVVISNFTLPFKFVRVTKVSRRHDCIVAWTVSKEAKPA